MYTFNYILVQNSEVSIDSVLHMYYFSLAPKIHGVRLSFIDSSGEEGVRRRRQTVAYVPARCVSTPEDTATTDRVTNGRNRGRQAQRER